MMAQRWIRFPLWRRRPGAVACATVAVAVTLSAAGFGCAANELSGPAIARDTSSGDAECK